MPKPKVESCQLLAVPFSPLQILYSLLIDSFGGKIEEKQTKKHTKEKKMTETNIKDATAPDW